MTPLVPARCLVQMPWSPIIKIMSTRSAADPRMRLHVVRLHEIARDTHAVTERPFENVEVGEAQRQIARREAEKPEGGIERELIPPRPQQDLLEPRLHDFRQRPLMVTAQDERILGKPVLRRISELAIEFHLRVNPRRVIELGGLDDLGLGVNAIDRKSTRL